jgi:hypothetical protein
MPVISATQEAEVEGSGPTAGPENANDFIKNKL